LDETKLSIFLLDEEDRSSEGGLVRTGTAIDYCAE
jgi:hypothetical protein